MLSCRIYTCSAFIFMHLNFISYFNEYYLFPSHSEDSTYNHVEAFCLIPISLSFHLEENLSARLSFTGKFYSSSTLDIFRVLFSQCLGEGGSLSHLQRFCNCFHTASQDCRWELGLQSVVQCPLPGVCRPHCSQAWAGRGVSCCFPRKHMRANHVARQWLAEPFLSFFTFKSKGPFSCPGSDTAIRTAFPLLSRGLFIPDLAARVQCRAAPASGAWRVRGCSSAHALLSDFQGHLFICLYSMATPF